MANIMKEVANTLGIELEEEFKIEGYTIRYKLSEYGLERWDDTCKDWYLASGLEEILTGVCKIIKLSELILNDDERNYLSAIIKPFRDRVICIKKCEDEQDEYIGIQLKYYANEIVTDTLILPSFKKGTMYNKMETEKEYTLEELRL